MICLYRSSELSVPYSKSCEYYTFSVVTHIHCSNVLCKFSALLNRFSALLATSHTDRVRGKTLNESDTAGRFTELMCCNCNGNSVAKQGIRCGRAWCNAMVSQIKKKNVRGTTFLWGQKDINNTEDCRTPPVSRNHIFF